MTSRKARSGRRGFEGEGMALLLLGAAFLAALAFLFWVANAGLNGGMCVLRAG